MKKPKSIPLSDNPRCKDVSKFPLKTDKYDLNMQDDVYPDPNSYKTFWKTQSVENDNENNQQDNSESIQPLDSDSAD